MRSVYDGAPPSPATGGVVVLIVAGASVELNSTTAVPVWERLGECPQSVRVLNGVALRAQRVLVGGGAELAIAEWHRLTGLRVRLSEHDVGLARP